MAEQTALLGGETQVTYNDQNKRRAYLAHCFGTKSQVNSVNWFVWSTSNVKMTRANPPKAQKESTANLGKPHLLQIAPNLPSRKWQSSIPEAFLSNKWRVQPQKQALAC